MLYFISKEKVAKLPLYHKLWMAPVAHGLQALAETLTSAVDKFNTVVLKGILQHEAY